MAGLEGSGWYLKYGWKLVWLHRPTPEGGCTCGIACGTEGKHARWKGWLENPIASQTDIDYALAKAPDSNLGIITGKPSGIIVLDIDPRNRGNESMMLLRRIYGADFMPLTSCVRTGSGGVHYYFRHPGGGKIKNCSSALPGQRFGTLPGIDLKADGGQVVAPPSLHACGGTYKWEVPPSRVPPAPMPDWMLRCLDRERYYIRRRNGHGKKKIERNEVAPVPEGNRNNALISFLGRVIWEERSEQEVVELAFWFGEHRCEPPLPHAEVERTVRLAIGRWA